MEKECQHLSGRNITFACHAIFANSSTSSICVPMQTMPLSMLPVQDAYSSRYPVQTMSRPFPDNWRDSVFLISTDTGCSSRMDSLNGMFLLPRTDLQPEIGNIFCDKIGKYNPDAQMTHLSYNVAEGLWIHGCT